MTTIELTPQAATASVLVQVSGTPNDGPVSITRVDANGAAAVRLREGQKPIGGSLTIVDNEPALIGQVRYDVATDPAGVARRNLYTDPAAEVGLFGAASNVIATRSTAWAAAGTSSVETTPSGATLDNFLIAADASSVAGLQALGLVPGKTYTVSATCQLPAAQTGTTHANRTRRVVVFYGAGLVSSVMAVQPPNAAGVYRQSVTFTLPANSTHIQLRLYNGATNSAANIVRWDALVIEEGATDGSYFDGATPAAAGFTYRWTGTPHASTSEQVGSERASASTTLAGLVPLPQLTVPVLSTLGTELDLVLDYGAGYPSTGSVHDIVKGTAPIPNLGPLGARRGQLELYAADHPAALRIVSCYSRGHVVMLRQPTHEGLDLYHVADGTNAVRVTPDQGRWRVAVTYCEVRSPSAPQLGVAGWTYADLSAAYSSYAAVRAAFASYADLAAGAPR